MPCKFFTKFQRYQLFSFLVSGGFRILLLMRRAMVLALIGKNESPNKFKRYQRFILIEKHLNNVNLDTE